MQLTQLDHYKSADSETNWKDQFNKGKTSKEQKKLQHTVRFQPKTAERVKKLEESSGCSFAEAVRRLVRDGLESRGVQ